MSHDREIKTYTLDISNNNDNVNEDNNQVQEDEDLDAREEKIRLYNESVKREHDRAVRTNPFMFNTKDADKCNIHSIEDFYVRTKRKEECPMKEVLRTDNFRLSKRKKIILNAIKNWTKDFKENKNRVILKASDIKEAVKPVDIARIKVISYIFIPLGLISLLAIYFKMTNLWAVAKDFNVFGRTMHLDMAAAWTNTFATKWSNIVAVIGIYLAVASILFIGLYHSIFGEFSSYSKKYSQLSEKLSGKINSDFNTKSKKTLRYYKKALRKKECKMDPLGIESTGITDVDFSDLEALSDGYAHKMAKMGSRKTVLYILKFIFFKGTYLCSTTIFGYVMFEVVKGFFGGGI